MASRLFSIRHTACSPVLGFVAALLAGSIANRAHGQASGPSAALLVSVDQHGFEFRGRRCVLVGDSVTQGWMELGTDFDQNAYVDALARRGINTLMIWSYIGITDQIHDDRIGYDAPEIWPWAKTRDRFDLDHFNDAYFHRLRALVEYADAKDIVVLITVHDGWTKTRFAGHPFNQALGGPLMNRSQYVELADGDNEISGPLDPAWPRPRKHQYFLERFCDRLIRAVADQPNVIFEMFNEGEWYNRAKLHAFQAHFLRFFKKRTSRITMVNDDFEKGTPFRRESTCDVISFHFPNWKASTAATEAFKHYARAFVGEPAKPFFFSEPVPEYQGDASLSDALMRLMWGTLLGGAGFVVQNDTSYGFDPHSAMAKKTAQRDALLDLEGHAARFFNTSGIRLEGLRPSGALSSTGVCLANPGREYVVYSQGGTSLTLDLPKQKTRWRGRFYNPRTGGYQPAFEVSAHERHAFVKPDENDWVLHVQITTSPP